MHHYDIAQPCLLIIHVYHAFTFEFSFLGDVLAAKKNHHYRHLLTVFPRGRPTDPWEASNACSAESYKGFLAYPKKVGNSEWNTLEDHPTSSSSDHPPFKAAMEKKAIWKGSHNTT